MPSIKLPLLKEPITIHEILQCTEIECTDPDSLQFALQLAPGQYIYLESLYASYPAGSLKANPVYSALSNYLGYPDVFIDDSRAGIIDHLLHEDHWTFDKVDYSQIPEQIRSNVANAYGIDIQTCNDQEEYEQLICEGYFEIYI